MENEENVFFWFLFQIHFKCMTSDQEHYIMHIFAVHDISFISFIGRYRNIDR